MEVVILAGGLGTRLQTVVNDVPKPMAPINGKPFLAYQLQYWKQAGATRFILSVGYKKECIVDYFGDVFEGIPIVYCSESTPLGTGGGLLMAAQAVNGEHCYVINGDTFFAIDPRVIYQFHLQNDADLTLALFHSSDMRYTGATLDPRGKITHWGQPGSRLANGGLYCAKKSALLQYPWDGKSKVSFEENILAYYFEHKNAIFGLVFQNPFIDIGVPEDYFRVPTFLANIHHTLISNV